MHKAGANPCSLCYFGWRFHTLYEHLSRHNFGDCFADGTWSSWYMSILELWTTLTMVFFLLASTVTMDSLVCFASLVITRHFGLFFLSSFLRCDYRIDGSILAAYLSNSFRFAHYFLSQYHLPYFFFVYRDRFDWYLGFSQKKILADGTLRWWNNFSRPKINQSINGSNDGDQRMDWRMDFIVLVFRLSVPTFSIDMTSMSYQCITVMKFCRHSSQLKL